MAEWITYSNPSRAGVHRYGEANVLSTDAGTPASPQSAPSASRSATVTLGLAIVSTWKSAAPGSAARTASRSCGSTRSTSTPSFGSTLVAIE